jgi:hypothetical protein
MATKENLKALEKALDRAADLSRRHAMAVQKASQAFEKAFGVEVPEECFKITGGDEANTVGSLFNNYANYGENMCGSEDTGDLVEQMNMLMERAFR